MKWLSMILSATTVMVPGHGTIAADTEGRTPVGVISSQSEPLEEQIQLEDLFVEPNEALGLKPPVAKTLLQEEAANQARLIRNTTQMKSAIAALRKHVGKTWYVFSGETPRGWDCSGLVRWTYNQVGIELEHSATAQANAGEVVTDPVPGDIVGFAYDGRKSFYHVGLYIGNGKMIHAKARGTTTRIESIKEFAGESVNVRFIRIVDQLQPAS
jgi:cell wall-associated NlpC family hydrolase